MAFWEHMKIWQMGQLLTNRELPDIREVWDEWAERIRNTRSNLVVEEYLLSGLPKVPAAYFLAFIAALCESEQETPHLEMDEIGEAYLSGILDESRDWKQCISILLPPSTPLSPPEKALACWSHYVLRHTADFLDTGIHINTELGELLNRIWEANKLASAKRQHEESCQDGEIPPEREIPSDGIENLKTVMKALDDDWKQLCQTYAAPNPTVETLCSLIQNGVRQIILTGAPGTGKTHAAAEAAKRLGGGSRIQMAQFHPSYDYTDFVEGLRPVQLAGETKSTFVRLDGSFKAFCRRVAEENRQRGPENDQPQPLYFFLIDEINRANLSQVFGELMFCLEDDKRGKPVQTQYRNLPTYRIGNDQKAVPIEDDIFSDGFFIPKNVVIIGTMNDIDRSVESMDFALRRRFIWHEVKAEESLLKAAFESGNFGQLLQENAEEAARRVTRLNDIIENSASFGLNRHYDISQGQFHLSGPKGKTLEELLLFVWKHRIEPLLREYVRGENPADVDAFIQKCAQALNLANEKNAADPATRHEAQKED